GASGVIRFKEFIDGQGRKELLAIRGAQARLGVALRIGCILLGMMLGSHRLLLLVLLGSLLGIIRGRFFHSLSDQGGAGISPVPTARSGQDPRRMAPGVPDA